MSAVRNALVSATPPANLATVYIHFCRADYEAVLPYLAIKPSALRQSSIGVRCGTDVMRCVLSEPCIRPALARVFSSLSNGP